LWIPISKTNRVKTRFLVDSWRLLDAELITV
jgi:hypothetical protein